MKKTIIILAIAFYIVQCTSSNKLVKNADPTEKELAIAQKTNPLITLNDLKAGQAIFINQCTECHKAYTITKFSEKKWKHEIDDMSPKAKLTDEQKATLSNYILSYREANTVVVK